MKLSVHYHPEFERDVTEAAAWLDARATGLGTELARDVTVQLDAVIRSPGSYPIVHGHVRRVIVRRFRYLIFYRVLGEQLLFLGMVHGARDVDAWLDSRVGKP